MFFNSLGDSFKQRLNLWWNFSAFNRIDALMTVLIILTLTLRFVSGVSVINAKNVYGIMCIFLFIRVLREYTASSFLGPKLVMINQMVIMQKYSSLCFTILNKPTAVRGYSTTKFYDDHII